jgi:hypothetical protein
MPTDDQIEIVQDIASEDAYIKSLRGSEAHKLSANPDQSPIVTYQCYDSCHQDKLACATDPAQGDTRICTLGRQLQSRQQHGAQDSTIRTTINQEIFRSQNASTPQHLGTYDRPHYAIVA